MNDTSGFYAIEGETLLYAPNFVYFPDKTTLLRENKDNYEYPVKGWYWFDTENDATNFFQIDRD
jgi:hypothetical protein